MKDNQKFLSGFLLGAAAGAVVTVFLQSDNGQKIINGAKSSIKDATADLKSGIENVDTALENWLNKGRKFLADIRNKNATEDLYDYEEIFS